MVSQLIHQNVETKLMVPYAYSKCVVAKMVSKAFPEFGMIGDDDTRKRETAVFFGRTYHETDPLISFETAIRFWRTPHSSDAPSCRDVITGKWAPHLLLIKSMAGIQAMV
ncbi:unnamed protein product [Dovyalis caffra]|uniref:Glycoside hydrolase family 19 catalytic domain-containing protein n=1 Tax=Dovyalis caffra TaxID=77055 RepID=A0AAV1R8N1_9ROSI|nr:unnamed protein product [Dovyalis caffra]